MKITITNTGKIKNANIEVADFTILVGKNSTNKSYTAHIVYDTIDAKSNPSLKKKLINCTVKGYIVEVIQNKKFDGIIC